MCRKLCSHNWSFGPILVALLLSLWLFNGLLLNPSLAQFACEVAPDFDVVSLDGGSYSNFHFEGEKALLMFWAPWCGVCRSEIPKLAQFYEEDSPSDLQVLSIGTSASLADVEGYVNRNQGTFVFPTAYDEHKVMAGDFGIRAFPTYILLGQDGTILMVHRGSGILNDQEFHSLIQ